jgi:truncated hemoglobin YjbI
MLCWAAGGPQKYTGKDMESSHRHLRITPGEWDAFMDDVAQTLEKFAVPAAERAIIATDIPARLDRLRWGGFIRSWSWRSASPGSSMVSK